MKRDQGSGNLRIDTAPVRREDIYALLFASEFRIELIFKYSCLFERRKVVLEKLVDNFIKQEDAKEFGPLGISDRHEHQISEKQPEFEKES